MTPVPPFFPHAGGLQRTARNLLVLQTYVVHRADGTFHYEIHLAPDDEAVRTVLVTRNEQAYQFALALEGATARVDAAWHYGRRGSHRYCVLDTLEAGAAS